MLAKPGGLVQSYFRTKLFDSQGAVRYCVLAAVPFIDPTDLLQHWEDHTGEFGNISPGEYDARAERFLYGPLAANTRHCNRPQGGWCRYSEDTEEYGVVKRDGFIATYMIPNPLVHGFATNLDYFLDRCR